MIQHFFSKEVAALLSHIPPHVWFWMWVSGYVIGSAFLLWVLAQVKTILGWPGVVVVLLIILYLFGFERGWLHQSINPFDNPLTPIIEVFK